MGNKRNEAKKLKQNDKEQKDCLSEAKNWKGKEAKK